MGGPEPFLACRRWEIAMRMEWLEDFLHLAETQSFSQSAADRRVTQPAFSRRIRDLEIFVGAPLVDRTTFPTTLTPAGLVFRKTAEQVVRMMKRDLGEFRAQGLAAEPKSVSRQRIR